MLCKRAAFILKGQCATSPQPGSAGFTTRTAAAARSPSKAVSQETSAFVYSRCADECSPELKASPADGGSQLLNAAFAPHVRHAAVTLCCVCVCACEGHGGGGAAAAEGSPDPAPPGAGGDLWRGPGPGGLRPPSTGSVCVDPAVEGLSCPDAAAVLALMRWTQQVVKGEKRQGTQR